MVSIIVDGWEVSHRRHSGTKNAAERDVAAALLMTVDCMRY
jgi:hypothetical protein